MKLVELLLFLTIPCYISVLVLGWLFILFLPNFPWLPGNITGSTWYLVPVTHVFPLYSFTVLILSSLTVVQGTAIYGLIVVPFLIHELTLGRKRYHTLSKMREITDITRMYRSAQILQHQVINLSLGAFCIPNQGVTSILFIFGGFVAINRRNELSTISYLAMLGITILFPMFWGVVLTIGGYMHSKGLKLLRSWKTFDWGSKHDKAYMSRFVKSSKPLMLSWGKMYVIRKISVLCYMMALMRGLSKACLSL